MEFSSLQNLFDYVKRDRYAVSDAEWEEARHPRDDSGQFASGNGDNSEETAEARKIPRHIKETKRAELKDKLQAYIKQGFIKNKDIEKANISQKSIDKMGCDKALNKSLVNGFSVNELMTQRNGLVSFSPRLGELFPTAELKRTDPDRNNDPNVRDMKRFRKDFITCEGKKASAWITVKNSTQHGNRLYTIEVMELKKADEKSAIRGGAEKQTHASSINIADNAPEVKSIAELWRMIKSA